MSKAVFSGKSGSIPADTLVPITDELLAKEREEKEQEIEADRKRKEAELQAAQAEIEAEERAKLEALGEKEKAVATASSSGDSEEEKMKSAAAAAAAVRSGPFLRRTYHANLTPVAPAPNLQAKIKEETEALLAEENRLKAEAARLEELMRQLDMSDDDDDEM